MPFVPCLPEIYYPTTIDRRDIQMNGNGTATSVNAQKTQQNSLKKKVICVVLQASRYIENF